VKVFLDASTGERARRRFHELVAAGRSVDLAGTLREMEERDKRDSERDIAPLRQAADAVRVDSSSVDAERVAAMVMDLVKQKTKEN
jgi:cytidylate kinase